jgi:hypothetical protein
MRNESKKKDSQEKGALFPPLLFARLFPLTSLFSFLFSLFSLYTSSATPVLTKWLNSAPLKSSATSYIDAVRSGTNI